MVVSSTMPTYPIYNTYPTYRTCLTYPMYIIYPILFILLTYFILPIYPMYPILRILSIYPPPDLGGVILWDDGNEMLKEHVHACHNPHAHCTLVTPCEENTQVLGRPPSTSAVPAPVAVVSWFLLSRSSPSGSRWKWLWLYV